ncbi:heterokaryon incompatibility protein-domain-containing protein [Immersiella caudata]|uniref:Heterokaryon incompatibility protein-domain-containing protein n=1 Tax=Immersiella caudata TaxID=314043 RepID=A0AA39WP84_9PEZI|nr:heterokaryon incompatibility protein-domain-containing protein [Immersiella caudata]
MADFREYDGYFLGAGESRYAARGYYSDNDANPSTRHSRDRQAPSPPPTRRAGGDPSYARQAPSPPPRRPPRYYYEPENQPQEIVERPSTRQHPSPPPRRRPKESDGEQYPLPVRRRSVSPPSRTRERSSRVVASPPPPLNRISGSRDPNDAAEFARPLASRFSSQPPPPRPEHERSRSFGSPLIYISPPGEESRPYPVDDVKPFQPPAAPAHHKSRRVTLTGGELPAFDDDSVAIRPEDSRSQLTQSVGLTSKPSLSRSSTGTLGKKVYQYSQLQEGEFRLVELLPARMSTIKCKVHHASLRNPPRYTAVSYAWGDPGDTAMLSLENVEIPVALSLHGALAALRHPSRSLMIWIDALCIDQQNGAERTEQVHRMTDIYSNADTVAIWLGPEADDSDLATDILKRVASDDDPQALLSFLTKLSRRTLGTVVALFEREYWRRLWVVQEVFHAKDIMVYCGSSSLPWSDYKRASDAFVNNKAHISHFFPSHVPQSDRRAVATHFGFAQVLTYQGPASLPDLASITGLGDASLLEVMRACRRKLSTEPRDKVFGLLGVLPPAIRDEFPVDYNLPVKEVYTNVVDYLLHTTHRLDVICESIHFPVHTSSFGLPSWVPDWSHSPLTAAMGLAGRFSAAGTSRADARFVGRRRGNLDMAAIEVGRISVTGMSVGTACTLGDYLMAFLHWRALLLGRLREESLAAPGWEDTKFSRRAQSLFCRTLCLDQVPARWASGQRGSSNGWLAATYHVFASLMGDRLPELPLDRGLWSYVDADVGIKSEDRRGFLQGHFGSKMMGRCFCITEDGRMGMGSGSMTPGDVIVVPLGCSTPVILRPEGGRGEHRFVGDVYLDGYMYGRAMEEMGNKEKEVRRYVLH